MIAAVVQARMSSTRLPGKVLKPILGQPMIVRQIERIQQSARIDATIVATSESPSDDPLASIVETLDASCFRGSLDDVLDRVFRAGQQSGAQHIVRLTADCPLVDARVLDNVVEKHLANEHDYTSNFLQRSFPDGLDVEIFKLQSLEAAWREATLPDDREHVTPFIYRQPDRFDLGSLSCDQDLATLRWTVDYAEDLEFVSRIFESLYPESKTFSMGDVLELLRTNPELSEINAARREHSQ